MNSIYLILKVFFYFILFLISSFNFFTNTKYLFQVNKHWLIITLQNNTIRRHQNISNIWLVYVAIIVVISFVVILQYSCSLMPDTLKITLHFFQSKTIVASFFLLLVLFCQVVLNHTSNCLFKVFLSWIKKIWLIHDFKMKLC